MTTFRLATLSILSTFTRVAFQTPPPTNKNNNDLLSGHSAITNFASFVIEVAIDDVINRSAHATVSSASKSSHDVHDLPISPHHVDVLFSSLLNNIRSSPNIFFSLNV